MGTAVDDRPTTIQEAVLALKERTGLSYAQMGVRAELDGTTVHKLAKTGRGNRETVTKLANAFAEDVDYWLRLVGLTRRGVDAELSDYGPRFKSAWAAERERLEAEGIPVPERGSNEAGNAADDPEAFAAELARVLRKLAGGRE
jgi:hypothetical protein